MLLQFCAGVFLSVYYFVDGFYLPGVITCTLLVIPTLIIQLLSARWYAQDGQLFKFTTCVSHLLLLQPFERWIWMSSVVLQLWKSTIRLHHYLACSMWCWEFRYFDKALSFKCKLFLFLVVFFKCIYSFVDILYCSSVSLWSISHFNEVKYQWHLSLICGLSLLQTWILNMKFCVMFSQGLQSVLKCEVAWNTLEVYSCTVEYSVIFSLHYWNWGAVRAGWKVMQK